MAVEGVVEAGVNAAVVGREPPVGGTYGFGTQEGAKATLPARRNWCLERL